MAVDEKLHQRMELLEGMVSSLKNTTDLILDGQRLQTLRGESLEKMVANVSTENTSLYKSTQSDIDFITRELKNLSVTTQERHDRSDKISEQHHTKNEELHAKTVEMGDVMGDRILVCVCFGFCLVFFMLL